MRFAQLGAKFIVLVDSRGKRALVVMSYSRGHSGQGKGAVMYKEKQRVIIWSPVRTLLKNARGIVILLLEPTE